MRAAGRIFVPGMGLLIAALGLILVASLARSEAGPQPRPAAATPAAVPP